MQPNTTNKRMESARSTRPTRNGEAPLLAAHSQRLSVKMTESASTTRSEDTKAFALVFRRYFKAVTIIFGLAFLLFGFLAVLPGYSSFGALEYLSSLWKLPLIAAGQALIVAAIAVLVRKLRRSRSGTHGPGVRSNNSLERDAAKPRASG